MQTYIAQFPAWTYADFEQRVWQIAEELKAQRIHTVALWFEDSAKLACTLLACWHAQVRTLFLPNATQDSINWANSLADIWLADSTLEGVSVKQFDQFAQTQTLQKTIQNSPLFAFDPNVEFLLKTSGSTGTPKTITQTSGQLWLNAQVCAKAFGFEQSNDVTAVCTVSIQHLYGLICQVMMPLVLGWQVERKQQFYPEYVEQACKRATKAVLISSPTMLSSIDWQRLQFPNLQGIISAGGMLAPITSQQIFTALQLQVTDFYGSTEAGAIAMRRGEVEWTAMPQAKVGTDERGALWIEAPWFKGREQTEDVVTLNGNRFEMHGRADRILKLGDKRISLVGVEHALLQHDCVADCYIGKHPDFGRLVAWVALSDLGQTHYYESRKNLVAKLKQHLSLSQEHIALPRFWRFCRSLPRNAQSKISKLAFEEVCRSEQRDQL